MKNYEFILGIDPSGSFWEGKGTTGWSLYHTKDKTFIKTGAIKAKDYANMEVYWDQIIKMINDCSIKHNKKVQKKRDIIVVIEDYLLYGNKAESQINSRMETPKLIGVLQYYCYKHNLPYYMQTAALVKNRWADDILEYKGYLKRKGMRYELSEHIRDSMRHAIHFATFKNGVE